MTRVTKALVLAGAAAMVLSPMVASATGSVLPVLAQGVSQSGDDDDDDKGLGVLAIGGIVLGLALGGLLVAGGSGGSGNSAGPDGPDTPGGPDGPGAKPQSN